MTINDLGVIAGATSIEAVADEMLAWAQTYQEEVHASFDGVDLVVYPSTTKEEVLASFRSAGESPERAEKRELEEWFRTMSPEEVAELLVRRARNSKPKGGRGNGPAMLYKGVSFPGD
jgi:hypothetical protein